MAENGFIDLRIGHGVRGPGDDSVWPSFTDIMTVVVMIFLMALVIIMIRNSDLNRQLLSSMDINQAISSANLGLTSEVSELRSNLLALQKALGDTESDKQSLSDRLADEVARATALLEAKQLLDREVAGLEELRSSLSSENLILLAEKDQLTGENRTLSAENARLRQANAVLEQNLGELTEEKVQLLAQSAELTQNRDLLATQKEALESEKQGLIGERDSLKTSLGRLETQNLGLRQDKEELIGQRQSLAGEVETLLAARRQLQSDLESMRLENQELESQRSTLSTENQLKQSTIEDLAQQERILSGQLAEISRQLDQLTISSTQEIKTLTQRNLSLSDQLDDVNLKLALLQLELERQKEQEVTLLQQLSDRKQEFEQLQQSEQAVLLKFAVASEEIEELSRLIQVRERENRALQAEADRQGSLFVSLKEEYEALEEQYRSLVRAARSPAGKEVVQVYFSRGTAGYEYRLVMPGGDEQEDVTRGELDRRLAALKDLHGRNLYTRVIIPETSNLSHNEAWRFTQEILNRYDYYYQQADGEE
ncbi:MAG: hypothetical protein F4128_06820 [Gammaproteobacteria bacterium]|nr:hypothetical protein [Gammaproteobacteria bacterium]